MITKKNVIVYTIQIDSEKLVDAKESSFELYDLFRAEFKKAGLHKEADKMEKGGFSYRLKTENKYYSEYDISIVTKTSFV